MSIKHNIPIQLDYTFLASPNQTTFWHCATENNSKAHRHTKISLLSFNNRTWSSNNNISDTKLTYKLNTRLCVTGPFLQIYSKLRQLQQFPKLKFWNYWATVIPNWAILLQTKCIARHPIIRTGLPTLPHQFHNVAYQWNSRVTWHV